MPDQTSMRLQKKGKRLLLKTVEDSKKKRKTKQINPKRIITIQKRMKWTPKNQVGSKQIPMNLMKGTVNTTVRRMDVPHA